ncbi:putative alcohol dehydrogenase [Tilletiaria anomala UBC 951]|uniref:hydroxyacid-oxoacid transhydrogenase n=1 Tax=Tilletiaria anomala (strain ATCC 24038 / CBS 436.72 / UBC 951) TaxID=1037660 RepID=A0A066W7T4_TILAU|nr:putative alcohol dehydrogenase [Tilletiaria anomala UBC 951]KDN46820.1 putative alcohol dehydrogenase [Tilletiaria anomala UBC 951]
MSKAATRSSIFNVMRHAHNPACPCHGCASMRNPANVAAIARAGLNMIGKHNVSPSAGRHYATPVDHTLQKEYAFELAASNIRYGEGVTQEVGMDFKNLGATKVGVFTDSTVRNLTPMKQAIESLERAAVRYEIYDKVRVEPNDLSWYEAIDYARKEDFSHFLAVGGGSVMDTCKVANLFTCYPQADLLDFINAPIGKGQPIDKVLRPLIAVPTTAGTGSETTGTAITDIASLQAKTGIASRALRPLLGIVDPLNTETCPTAVHISAGLDVLGHSLESYTALPYNERVPRPSNPILRPSYQGSNPISDVFSLWALKQVVKYLPRIAKDRTDVEARGQMLLAATFAGIGFGNAGVHLCHGMSYPISGLNKKFAKYQHPGYEVTHPIVPHGISVALTIPAVFEFTAPSSPDRHREIAAIFKGHDAISEDSAVQRLPDSEVGKVVYDRLAEFLARLGVPRGLAEIGYKSEHIPDLVQGTLPQKRVTVLAPGIAQAPDDGAEHISRILEKSMSY